MLTHLDLATMTPSERTALVRRSAVPDPSIRSAAVDICRQVQIGGDEAMRAVADRVGGGFRRITDREIDAAVEGLDEGVRAALTRAIDAVTAVHLPQVPRATSVETAPGVSITREWAPLRRVGAYVPGGKATYPSTVVMTVVPAMVAGVSEIVVATPASDDGNVAAETLAAARMAGATEVWAMGGAQAIAALAYGTSSVAPVEKIVGPGNSWVTAAKLEVFGTCAIDLPAGPSEVLVLADATSDPTLCAADMLCQAEHGPDSPAVLVSTDADLIASVETELEQLLGRLDRADILSKALADHGLGVLAPDRTTAIEFVNDYAAEHVTLLTQDAEADAGLVSAAGSIYVGPWAPESAGDYATGANHVLPTGGLAAACGPLSTQDYGSWRQVQRINREGLRHIAPTITSLAGAEGLSAHALAASIRLDRQDPQ